MFACQGCGYKAKTLQELFKHVRVHHGGPQKIKKEGKSLHKSADSKPIKETIGKTAKNNIPSKAKKSLYLTTRKSEKKKGRRGYSSGVDGAIDKATETGRRIWGTHNTDKNVRKYLERRGHKVF